VKGATPSVLVLLVAFLSAATLAQEQTASPPLGIEDVIWPSDPQGVSYGWGDLHLRPRDMAKIGYLWLNQGRWEGQQIVPAEWMQAATHAHSHPAWGNGEYGYGFWVYPQRNPIEYEALGRGGQRITVTPAENRIVVFTGGEFEPGDIGKFIGESIKSGQPLPENPTGQARLAAAVSAAARPPGGVGDSHDQGNLRQEVRG
jgi:CubicO group peptidase (beta-lactamase class C family)